VKKQPSKFTPAAQSRRVCLHSCKLSIVLIAFILLLILNLPLPAFATVEGFVARSSDGSFHQYSYNELLDSYAFSLLGSPNGIYEDYKAKKPVAILNSEHGYFDYNDILKAYASALLRREYFCLNAYTADSMSLKAIMPASLLAVTFESGQLVRQTITLGNYSAESSEPVTEPEPEKPKTNTPIAGTATVTLQRAQQWAKNSGAHQRFIDIAPLYWEYGSQSGIRPEVLYAQAALETGLGCYGGQVPPEYNNWAGIKIGSSSGDKPEDHEQFATPADGVRAHFNHVAAYVGLKPIGEPHNRYFVVARLSWAGSIKHVEELSGKWAPSENYHERIVAMLEGMQ
jgi:hypothetical protein